MTGKTTLLAHLARQPGVITLPEPVHRWQNVKVDLVVVVVVVVVVVCAGDTQNWLG